MNIQTIIKRSVDKTGITGRLSNTLDNFAEACRENSYVAYDVVPDPRFEELEKQYPPEDLLAQGIIQGLQSPSREIIWPELVVVRRGKWMWNIGSLVYEISYQLWKRFKL